MICLSTLVTVVIFFVTEWKTFTCLIPIYSNLISRLYNYTFMQFKNRSMKLILIQSKKTVKDWNFMSWLLTPYRVPRFFLISARRSQKCQKRKNLSFLRIFPFFSFFLSVMTQSKSNRPQIWNITLFFFLK